MRAFLFAFLAGATVAPVTLKRVPEVGQKQAYQVEMNADFAGEPLIFRAKGVDEVREVNADGTFSVQSTQEEGKIEYNGQELEGPEVGPSFTLFAPNGEVKDLTGEMADADAVRLARLSNVVFPADAKDVGATWEYDHRGDATKNLPALKITFKYEGTEKVGEVDANVVSLEGTEQDGEFPASVKGKIWLDPVTGMQLKAELEMKQAPVAGNRLDLTLKITPVAP